MIQLFNFRKMAKANTILVRLQSTESHFFFVKKKNPKTLTGKLEFRKYDPVVRKHVIFKEKKLS